jgi:hypothetical protein
MEGILDRGSRIPENAPDTPIEAMRDAVLDDIIDIVDRVSHSASDEVRVHAITGGDVVSLENQTSLQKYLKAVLPQ